MRKIRYWTPDEVYLLELWAGEIPVERIARRLKRSKPSVRAKAHNMKLKLKPDNDNFSLCGLSKILGCYRRSLAYWIRKGELKGRKTSNGHSGHYRVSRKDFKAFYLNNQKLSLFKGVDPDIIKYLIS